MAEADRVTICHLGGTKTALTISLDPPWTLAHVHLVHLDALHVHEHILVYLDALQLASASTLPKFFVHSPLTNMLLSLIGCLI